jgi:acyl-CoA thioester hydrolase
MSTEPGRQPEVSIDVEVRYAETDQMGVVHHAAFVVWLEIARTRLCALSGWHYAEIERLGFRLVVTGVELSYRRPARYGDVVQVACHVERSGSRGVDFGYRVTRGGELLATGRTEHVWIDASTGRPCRTPEPLREAFARLAGGE